MNFWNILICSPLLLTGFSVFASEQKWTHYGARPLAMGNAFVAVADDYNALFYNPAGLARLTEWKGELLNPYVSISNATRNLVSDIKDLQGGSSGNIESVLDLVEEQSGKVHHLGVGATPHLIISGFGIGVGLDLSGTLVFHRYPTIDVDLGPTIIIPVTYAFNTLEDRLSIGFGLKMRMEGGLNQEFSLDDLEAFTSKKSGDDAPKLSDYVQGGRGYGADVGLLFTPIKVMEPTLGLSITDLGGMTYDKMNVGGKAVSQPERRLASVNTGFSFKPYQTGSRYWLFAVDAHSFNQPFSFTKKLNFGSEYSLGQILKLQLGLHQGYLSGGFQFDVRLLKIRFVTYGEEVGESAGSIQDRRYVCQLKLLI